MAHRVAPRVAAIGSALLGALTVLSFAPFGWFWVAPLSIAGLAYLLLDLNPRQAWWSGFGFGMGQYLVGVSWVYVSLSTYGGMPLWMGIIAVSGFCALVAVFIGLTAYFCARFWPANSVARLIAFPFVWVIFEWMKSWVLTGFPWLDIGYSQTSSWLFSWAPVGGLYLTSLAVVLLAVSIVLLLHFKKRSSLLVVVAIVGGSWALNNLEWTEQSGEPIQVRVVQGNVAIETKWQAASRDETIIMYQRLSHELDASGAADLIVWPETALALGLHQVDMAFWKAMAPQSATLITGLVEERDDGSYNAAVMRCKDQIQPYRKRHLVPFGEYLPLRFLFNWVLDYLQLPMSDFSSWQGMQPLQCGGIGVALTICYEDAFSGESRAHLGDATMLVNISEDAWFGDSFAPHQRKQMAQMRARELGRPMVRSANSGPSLFIDHRGAVLVETEQFQTLWRQQSVQPMTGSTPFVQIGNWPIWLSGLIILLMLVLRRRQQNS